MGDVHKVITKPLAEAGKAVGLGDLHQSSAFTGAGTPWGAMETGRPSDPQFEGYESDLSKYRPDISNQMAEAQRGLALQGGGAMRQLQAQAAKLGGAGTTTADLGRRMGDVATQTDYNQRKASADLEMAALDMAMKQMEAINLSRQRANQLIADKYNRDAAAFNAEQQGRGQFWQGLASAGGSIAGGLLAGPLGAGLMGGGGQSGGVNEGYKMNAPSAPSVGSGIDFDLGVDEDLMRRARTAQRRGV